MLFEAAIALNALPRPHLVLASALLFGTINIFTELILSFVIRWGAYIRLEPAKRHEFRSRVVATIHAIALTAGPLWTFYNEPGLFVDIVDYPSKTGDVWCYTFGGTNDKIFKLKKKKKAHSQFAIY